MWIDSGKPNTGFLKDIRNSSRYVYHYALKFVRNNTELILSFWNSFKITKHHHLNLPNNIHSVTGSAEISDVFADKYYKLYNSVSYDNNELYSVLCPVKVLCGKAGSCLPLVGSLQYRTLANSMYWFPLPFQLPVVI